jgi:hypothetical protein
VIVVPAEDSLVMNALPDGEMLHIIN